MEQVGKRPNVNTQYMQGCNYPTNRRTLAMMYLTYIKKGIRYSEVHHQFTNQTYTNPIEPAKPHKTGRSKQSGFTQIMHIITYTSLEAQNQNRKQAAQ